MSLSIHPTGWALWLAAATLLVAGCGSSPPVPDWQLQTRQAADRATTAELTGHARVAEADWKRAQQQAARSALPEAVARVHLARCAARRASLDWSPCEGLAPLLPDAGAPLQAYARYLAGQPLAGDAALLPLAQQPVARHVVQASATTPLQPPPTPDVGDRGRPFVALGGGIGPGASGPSWPRGGENGCGHRLSPRLDAAFTGLAGLECAARPSRWPNRRGPALAPPNGAVGTRRCACAHGCQRGAPLTGFGGCPAA